MNHHWKCKILAGVGAAVCLAGLWAGSTPAQQTKSSMFDADRYWSGYWDWYDTEYVPSYRIWNRGHLDNYRYLRGLPSVSGAPSAGGDYDDYPAHFYVPGGAAEFYTRKLQRPPGETPPSRTRPELDVGETGPAPVAPPERRPDPSEKFEIWY